MLTILAANPPSPEVLLDGLANDLTTMSVVIRLTIAAALGGLIGLERKIADKPADGRTMMLICAGAAAFTLLGLQISADAGPEATTRVDPTRVLSYIISGVGFLGAGAILHNKKSVKGLTTAAAVWVAAAIGAACGLAMFDTALVMFFIVIAALWAPWIFSVGKDDDDGEDDRRPGLIHTLTGNTNGNGPREDTPPAPPASPAPPPAPPTPPSEKNGKGEKGEKGEKGDKDKSKGDKGGGKDDKDNKDKSKSKSGKND